MVDNLSNLQMPAFVHIYIISAFWGWDAATYFFELPAPAAVLTPHFSIHLCACASLGAAGSKSEMTASRFISFHGALGIIFTLRILFFNAKME